MADYGDFFLTHGSELQQAPIFSPRPNPTFGNPSFDGASGRVLIARLSPFHDVERSSSHLVLAQFVRRALPAAFIDLAFFPPRHDRERLSSAGVPLLFGCQSFRSARDFDLILVSNSYLLELINLPYWMQRSGIPLWASERDKSWPPIVLGGSNAAATQAIVNERRDCLADALFFGEGEDQLVDLVRAFVPAGRVTKKRRLETAAQAAPGLWLAGSSPGTVIEPASVRSPRSADLLTEFPVLSGAEAGTARLQISYGCPAFCSFCFEGYDRKPYREVSRAEILDAARRLKSAQGCERVEIDAFNFNTHSAVPSVLFDLHRIFAHVNAMSQRTDILASTPGMAELEMAAGKRHFTFGIEGISERQRAFLNKSLTEGEIRRALGATLDQRPRQIKLFYLFTGHEHSQDVDEFRGFVSWLKARRARGSSGPRVTFSFGWLVRMPFTPLRYDRLFIAEDHWRPIVGPVKSICETNDFEFRMAMTWDEYCASQVLALGGHWLAEGIIGLAAVGHCYDAGLPSDYWDELRTWARREGRWDEAFIGEKSADYDFPMAFVRPRVSARFLHRMFQHAKACEDQGYCLGTVDRAGRCLACGACEDEAQRSHILDRGRLGAVSMDSARELATIVRRKRRIDPVYVRAWVPPSVCGASVEWINAACFRQLLAVCPPLASNLLRVREALFSTADNRDRFPVFAGETVFGLSAWDAEALLGELLPAAGTPETANRGAHSAAGDLAAPSSSAAEGGQDQVRVLGPAAGFTPGRWKRATLALSLPSASFPDARGRLIEFLRGSYVACNVRRVAAGWALELPEKALRKKWVFAGAIEEDEATTEMTLAIGPKFDLGGYLASFPGRGRHLEAQVALSELVW